jgi:asparagine synthase (glutamine-hydrolysing)
MCGIAGSVGRGDDEEIHSVRSMTDALIHRGPDAGAVVRRGQAVLGHRRLAIIDITEMANQPMDEEIAKLTIVFNGAIYNFREIRAELEANGETFRTQSDTEVLLKSYLRWGEHCLQRLNGMFAFAIWNHYKQTLFMARDRLGKKPLYYLEIKGGLIFASELPALLRHPALKNRTIDPKALGHYLGLNYTLGERCIIQGVEKLPAANFLTWSPEKPLQKICYWKLSDYFYNKKQFRNSEEAAESLNELIDDAVRLRMVSNVPLGAFLSGGLDSSTLVASMTRQFPQKEIKTYTIGFQEKGYSEALEAREIADFLHTTHHEKVVDAQSGNMFRQLVRITGEPFADTSIIPFQYLTKFAREGITVAISGDGGDELFAGYTTYAADRIHNIARFTPKPLSKAILKIARKLITATRGKVSFDYKLFKFMEGLELSPADAHCHWRTIFNEEEKRGLILPELKEAFGPEANPAESFQRFFRQVPRLHYLDQAMYVDIRTWLVDDIMVKVDRASMAHSLEARAPFLDYRLVEFAASLPVSYKLRGLTGKSLVKFSQNDRLPACVIHRKKAGFNAPISHWLEKKFGEEVRSVLFSSKMSQWFRKDSVEKLWNDHINQNNDNSLKLFGLACLGYWLEELDCNFMSQ